MAESTNPSRKVAISVILGFVVAFIAIGLPMIGITVNLWLGSSVLLLATGLLAYGFLQWEATSNWPEWARTSSVWVLVLALVGLFSLQVFVQYQKDHRARNVAKSEPPVAIPASQTQSPPTVTRPRDTTNSTKGAPTRTLPKKAHVADPPASAVPQQPTYEQKCDGTGPCAQGPGATSTQNNYGAPKLAMTNKVYAAIKDEMAPFAGMEIMVDYSFLDDDSKEYAAWLIRALSMEKLVVTQSPHGIEMGMGGEPGITVYAGTQRMKVATALSKALGCKLKQDSLSNTFEVAVNPNR